MTRAKENGRDVGAFPPVGRCAALGRTSPMITRHSRTHTSGSVANTWRRPAPSQIRDTTRRTQPATVVLAKYSHSGVPTRGPTSRVLVGSFMTASGWFVERADGRIPLRPSRPARVLTRRFSGHVRTRTTVANGL